MGKRQIRIGILAVLLVAILAVGGTLAYFTDADEASNVITMGKVSATLTETDPETGVQTTEGLTFKGVRPNQELKKDPVVTLQKDSAPAYIRMKMDVVGENLSEEKRQQLTEGMDINRQDWVYAQDGYYYYQRIVNPGEQAMFFTHVKIPDSWGNEVSSLQFAVNLRAEAIQADYFLPKKEAGKIIGWE